MKNLSKKLLLIAEGMGRLPKNGFNAFHKYNYVLESDAMDKFRELAIQHGVMVCPSAQIIGVTGDITSVDVNYELLDTESGERLVVKMPGQGQDKGDKGVYKALTGSFKYFIMKTFMVPTGDDPEHDEQGTKQVAPPPPFPRQAASKPQGGGAAPTVSHGTQTNMGAEFGEKPYAITDKQSKLAFAVAMSAGLTKEEMKAFGPMVTNKESTKSWVKEDLDKWLAFCRDPEQIQAARVFSSGENKQ